MLKRVRIKNFAIIDEQTLELGEGLNVLTGETGAGKSILVEALGFLLGARASATWIRTGAARLEVEGEFALSGKTVLVRRELDASGKTRAQIDGKPATTAALSALGDSLVDFHGQHEHQTLLKPAVQLELIDRFGGHDAEAAAAAAAFDAWSGLKAELAASNMSEEERRRRADMARFQLQELEDAGLRVGEEQELDAALPRLKNAERLKGFAAAAYEGLYDSEESALATLLKAGRALSDLSRVDSSDEARRFHERLEEARLALEELSHDLGAYSGKLDSDPAKLDAMLGRLDALARLKKKYGPSVEEMISFRDRTAAELKRLENAEQSAEELEKKLAAAERTLEAACEKLHAARVKAARKLERLVVAELKPLGMPNAEFSVAVELEEGRYARSGGDVADFLLAPNPGEPLKPVKAIASGGELSRVMLALKTVFAKADRVPTLVFDEVDAGIGGSVARAVGEKLSALGRARQVLCVTHLPQVACFAASHFWVGKQVVTGRTKTTVEKLEGAKRLEALALMLGGREATAASRKHAKELLEASTVS
jgi:DNA repair protein RecN (Recombination protein N)